MLRCGEHAFEPDAKTDELAHRTIGAAIAVHKELGPGFKESVYQKALEIELGRREIPFEHFPEVKVHYDGQEIGREQPDLVVAESLIVEMKATESMHPVFIGQVGSYLKATGICLGLILNFGCETMRDGTKRVVLTKAGRWRQQ